MAKYSYEQLLKKYQKTKKELLDLKYLQQIISEKEGILRTIAERSFAGIYIVQNGIFRFVNESAAAYAGYSQDELIGLKSDSIIFPEDVEVVKKNARAMLREEQSKPHEFRIVSKGGDIRWVMETVSSITYDNERAILGNSMNITEIKVAEERLKESEQQLSDIIEFLPDATFAIDRTGKVIAWNRAIESITEVKAIDIVGKGNHEYALPFYRTRRPILIDLVFKSNEKIEKKYNYIRREEDVLTAEARVQLQGKERVLWGKANPLRNSSGYIIGAIESMRDITERKQIEEALRESERRLSDIIEFLPDATFAIDRTGKVIAWNRAIESITEVKAIDIVGKGNHEYALPFYRTRRPILIDLVFKSNEKIEKKYNYIRREEDVLTAEARVQLQGKERVLWGKANPLRNSSGYIIGAIESMRDITERKQIEEALRESERRLSDIIEFLPDATFAIDRTGKVIAWNRAIENMTGVKAKDMMGKGNYEYAIPFYGERKPLFLDLVFKRDKNLEQSYSNLQRLDNILIAEKEISDFRGERVFLWGKAGPLYDDKGNIIGAIETIRDITEQKQIENSLRTREQELEVKNVQLEDLNATLRVLLKQRGNDRNDLEETVLANVKKLIVPFLEKMTIEPINAKTRAYLETLESNLRDIISPFAHKISSKYVNLTNREVQIASLIKDGRATKEIAEMLNLSESSINIHRYNMRKKLGLSKKHNLHAYLSIHA
jgi:PAS domain S-box-containing protein